MTARFIMSETTPVDKPLATTFPGLDEELPLEIDLLEQNSRIDGQAPNLISAISSESIGSFGREAQAAHLYAMVLETIHHKDPLVAHWELSQTDKKLQEFFGKVICHCGTTWGLYCGSIAFTIG